MVGTQATTNDAQTPNRKQSAVSVLLAALSLLLGFPFLTPSYGGEISPDPIKASGNTIYRWMIGDAQASLLEGDCVLQHAGKQLSANSVLLVSRGVTGRVETEIVVEGAGLPSTDVGQPLRLSFITLDEPEIQAPNYRGVPKETPTLVKFLSKKANNHVQTNGVAQVQYQEPQSVQMQALPSPNPTHDGPMLFDAVPSGSMPIEAYDETVGGMIDSQMSPYSLGMQSPSGIQGIGEPPMTLSDGATTGGFQFFVGGGTRSVEILARGASMPPQIETINRPESGETVVVARGGVTVLVRDVTAQLPGGELMQLGTISLSADRVVGWLPLVTDMFNGSANLSQSEGELYLEGDIVMRQGERIIYADSMYFNVNREIGVVLDAETITTIPEYQGIVRLKADVLQQVSKGNFIAFDAAVTSSRMGVPRYWLQSNQLQLTDREAMATDPTTGIPGVKSDPFVTSTSNFVYVAGVPVLYWPRFATPLREPTFYISGADIGSDDIFGTQILLDWNLLQIFGIDAPDNLDWELSTDYLSDRGPALGTNLRYELPGMFGVPGQVSGELDAWFIDDDGLDTLGGTRERLTPEKSMRGRTRFQHRHFFQSGYEFIAEVGYISDRNFLEQYFESEWDQQKNADTALRLRRYYYSNLFELSANPQLNDFFQETERLPAFDHYLLGGSVFADLFTWSAHNHISYSRQNEADIANDPLEAATMSTLPGEQDRDGVIARTRQELAMPVQAGPIKVVPYVSGEAAHYGQAGDGDSLTRLLGQAGVRASLPMTRIDPTIQSSLLNIRGLAHKVQWNADYFYADSDTNLEDLPLYDPLDDHAQQQFRRRFIFDQYGGSLPARFNPITYAFRNGSQRYVTSGSDTVADDLQQIRLGVNQRFQTKRGLPGNERIVDIFHLNTDILLFPKQDRDNFGETVGPATYDAAYHIGDRLSLLSDGYFDFFDSGLSSVSAGVRSSRPGVSEIYLGLLSLEGPISSTVFRSTIDYRMNEKWIVSSGMTYDFGSVGSVGQSFALTRIGESMLLRLGVNVDHGRDNVGFGFSIEPRFWPSTKLGQIGGQLIPPPGVEGLE